MWAVIKVDKALKFYNFQSQQYEIVGDLRFAHADELESTNGISMAFGGFTKVVLEHERCVNTLLKAGLPLFIKKTDAREVAKAINLTGYTYIQFEVSKIQL